MIYELSKVLISAIIIVLIVAIAKKHTILGAILASVPIVSVIALIWLYIDTQNTIYVAKLSKGIFWMVIPSLLFFISLPIFLNYKINFYLSLCFSLLITVVAYLTMLFFLKFLGIQV